MQKTVFGILTMLAFSVSIASCNCKKDEAAAETTEAAAVSVAAENKPNEEELKNFLYDPEGYYGWETTADKISFDFLKDGRLHIQGPDGEATMWEGTWKLAGDQITLDRKDLGKTEVYTVKIDGEKLVLGDKVYTRYKPS